MGMSADDQAGAAVTVKTHRLLLARRLAMNVDDDGVGRALERAGGKLALDRRERIVERVHEDAAHGVDDEHARAIARVDQRRAAAGRAGRKVDRPQQLRRALDEDERLLLIPGMVAAGDHVDAGIDELLVDRLGDAEAAGGILAVDGDEIEPPFGDQLRQSIEQDGAPAAADDVADEQDAHALVLPAVDGLALG